MLLQGGGGVTQVETHQFFWERTAEGPFMKLELYCGNCRWKAYRASFDWQPYWDDWERELRMEHFDHVTTKEESHGS